jgi:hypothetical protein
MAVMTVTVRERVRNAMNGVILLSLAVVCHLFRALVNWLAKAMEVSRLTIGRNQTK